MLSTVLSHHTSTDVKVKENATVTYAVNLLHSSKAETTIVTTKEGKPIGIVTDTDILDKVVEEKILIL